MKYYKDTQGQLYVDPIVENHEGLVEIDIYEFLLILKGDKDYSITPYEDQFMVYDGTNYLTIPERCPYRKVSVQDNGDGTGTWVDEYDYDYELEKWKSERQTKVNNIEVNYNGVIYQGDEISQARMSRTIVGMTDGQEIPWTAKDDSVHMLTADDLKAIMIDAGTQQTLMWNEGRPQPLSEG